MLKNHIVKDICNIALFSALLFIQEETLTFLPNIQLTVLLIVLYSKVFKVRNTIIIIIIYVLFDSIFMSSLYPLFMVFQIMGWSVVPILLNTLFKKIDSTILISLIGVLCSLLYSWIMIIPSCILFEMDVVTYFIADIPFEGILCASSLISILIFYKPLIKLLNKYINPNQTPNERPITN